MTDFVRHHFPDEELDVDELEWDIERERALTPGHCARCGLRGHAARGCPTVTPALLQKLSVGVIATAIAATSWMVRPTTASSTPEDRRGVRATAYAPGCGDSGRFANGEKAGPSHPGGTAAMNGVPFGSIWEITGGGLDGVRLRINDRIGHSSQFDVWLRSCAEARRWGKQRIQVRRVG